MVCENVSHASCYLMLAGVMVSNPSALISPIWDVWSAGMLRWINPIQLREIPQKHQFNSTSTPTKDCPDKSLHTNLTDQHESKHVLGHGGQDQGTGQNKDTECAETRDTRLKACGEASGKPRKDRDIREHRAQGESAVIAVWAGQSCPNGEGHNIQLRLCYTYLIHSFSLWGLMENVIILLHIFFISYNAIAQEKSWIWLVRGYWVINFMIVLTFDISNHRLL